MLHKILPIIALLTATLFGAPIPTATAVQPGSQLIGEPFDSQVCFTNTGDETGFGPQFEMVTPAGITLSNAQFYSFGAITYQETCTVSECNVTNPQTAQVRTIYENESFYILDYPIGSFATEWPEQCIDLTFDLESSGSNVQLGNPMDIQAYPLFTLGATAVDDGAFIYGTQHTMTVDPTVYTLEKSNDATEGERATGPSYPITATLLVDIADGEDVNSLQVVDTLSGGMQFLSLVSDGGCNISAPSLPSTVSPGGTLTLECGNVTGVLGTDRTITYTYYIPEQDDTNTPILGPNGQWQTLINQAEASADYNGSTLTPAEANSTVVAKAITMHKTSALTNDVVPSGFGPGDTVTYTLTMDVSDYFDHNGTVVTDVLGDGQHVLDPLSATYGLTTGEAGTFSPANVQVCTAVDPLDGTCQIDFDLSSELGGMTISSGTTITISFNAIIDQKYTVINDAGFISMGDTVGNYGSVQSNIPGVGVGIPDSSNAANTVALEQLVKTIYAINGITPVSAPYRVFPGDTVTYRLKSVMPVESFYDLNITDYLPIPIFVATEIAAGPDANAIPSAGTWGAGPDNNYDTSVPILSTNAAQNTITWAFNDDQDNDQATVIDILFTVTATSEPMADSLELANIAGTKYNNSAGSSFGTAGIINIEVQEPFISALHLKSIGDSTNPNSTFISAPIGYENAMDNVDANDTITYIIHLENSGHATAYDVNVTDRLSRPAMLCDLNSIVVDTNSTGVGSGDLFAGMYTIDHIEAGAYYDINYTCVVNQDANPGPDIDNTATLLSYASLPGGPNFVGKVLESKTKLELTGKMEIIKNIVASSIPDTNPDNNLNQGEIVNFEINVTLGEGTYTNYALTDNTCTALALQSQSPNVVVSGTTVTVLGTGGSVDGNLSYGCETQAITSGTNTATVTADLMGSEPASANWTVVNPAVITSKTMNPAQADAGDEVTVTMNWTNDPAHPAYQCSVVDPLDTSVFDISSVVMTTTPLGYTCNVVGNEVQCIYTGDLTLPCPNGPAGFTVNVRDDLNTSSDLVNELSFTGVTLPAGHSGEGDPSINGSVESNATAVLDLLSPVSPIKIFTKTSEDFTDPGDVNLDSTPAIAIGEVIDVNITYGFYEGRTLNVLLQDRFIDGGRLVYVPGTMTISRDNANIFVEEPDINTALTGSPIGTAVVVDDSKLSISSTLISLDVGDVINTNSTAGSVLANFTLHFRVKVQNESVIQAGVAVRDRGRVRFRDGADGATPRLVNGNTRAAIVNEPLPTITKDVNQSSVRAGTELTYTLKVCNDETNSSSSVTSGFDWNIADRIPDDILLSNGPNVDLNGTGAVVDTSASNGQDINATIDQLDKGECISISYEAIVQLSAQFGQILTNTANFTTTSLPGNYGTEGNLAGLAGQEPGEQNGERTGLSGVNNLFGSDSQNVVMNKAVIEKAVIGHKLYYAIGETVHYRINIGIPSGTASEVIVNDILPVGLEFNLSSVSYQFGPNLTAENPSPVPTQNGQVVSFDFGDINASTVTFFRLDYNVTVTNILSNQDNVSLQNDANITVLDPNNPGERIGLEPLIPAQPIVIGEPDIEMQKRITAGAVNAQAGKTVSWEVVISNDSGNNAHTTAYAVNWEDVLPSHLANISNTNLTLTGSPGAVLTGTNTPITNSDITENNTTVSLALFDLPVDATVTLTFDSIVQNDAVAGETQTNNTDVSYLSLLGADGTTLGGRNSDDCGDDDDNATLNNYCESAMADLIIDAGIAIDKNLQGTQANFTIGEQISYEMKVSLIEGITSNVVLTDILPAGLKYVSHTHQNGAPAMQYDFASANTNGGTDRNVIIDFGNVENAADGNTTNDYIDVELTVLVENVVGNQNGNTPSNGDGADGSSVIVTSDVNSSAVTVPVPITIVEPDLNVTKRVTPDTQATGDIVTYYIRLAHSSASTSIAYDINFTDTLPTDLTYIPGSVTGAPNFVQNGQILTFSFDNLPLATTRDISYKARISDTASIVTPLVNSLDTVYSGLSDANGSVDGGRNGTDGVGGALNDYALYTEAPVQPNHDELTPLKDQDVKVDTNNDGLINAGDILEYNLSVTNGQLYDVGDVNITDTLDPNVTLLLNSIMVNGTAYGESSATDWTVSGFWYTYASTDVDITYNSDTNYFEVYWQNILNAGDTLSVTYDVVINDGTVTQTVFTDNTTIDLLAGTNVEPGTVIDNIFTVDSNRTIPVDSNEVNVTTDQRGIAGIPDKNITGSSETFTTLPNVAVGEVIDVDLTFEFSGGTTKNVIVRDNYNTAQFSFVSGSENLTFSSADISVTNAVIIVEDTNGFSVDLGDVRNTHYEDLNMTETLILSFKLQVENNESVNLGDDLEDRADVTYLDYNRTGNQPDRNVTLQSPIVSVNVLEPLPSISKVNSNAAAQAGDPVTYTVTLCNDEAGTASNVASAFDWTASDVLPSDLIPQGIPRTDAGTTGATVDASFGGQTLSITVDQLDQGECVNVEYDVLIGAGVADDAVITNTVNMQTTSLPGNVTGERTGTSLPPLNDLHDLATSDIIIGTPSILKDVIAQQTYYAIGESVDYNVTINLPESVGSLELNDTLPAGLVYNTGSVRLVVPAGVTVQTDPPTVSQNGSVVTFDLGDVTMTGKQTIYLEFNATVENTLSNQQGTTLTNQVNMAYIEPDNNKLLVLPNVPAPSITVGEPTIVMAKQVTAGLVDSQAGDTVSYSISIENTGATTAFDVDWIDTLPEHLGQISNAQLSGIAYQSGTTTPLVDGDLVLSTVNVTDDTISLPAFDLPVGNTLTVTFDSILQPDVVANEILNNNTTSTWKSVLGAGSRDGTDGIGSGLNNYAAEANASMEVNATIAIVKSILGATTYTIGEELTYNLSVYFIRGITPDVSITDVLPDGLTYISHQTQSTDAGLTFASDIKSGTGQTVIIALGDVSNTATNNDHIDIEMKVRVDNVIGNQNGDTPANGGGASGTVVSATYNTPGVGVTEANVINPVTFTITEPDLSVSKTATPTTQALGDIATFNVHVTNVGTSTANDISLTDTLPAGLTYVDGSASEASVIHSGQILTFILSPLAAGASVDISYKAKIETTVDPTQPLVNSVYTVYGSIINSNGLVDGGRNGIDGIGSDATTLNNYAVEANATLQPNSDALTPVKSVTWSSDENNDTVVSAGDILAYDLSVTNTLGYDVGDVNVTDTLSPDVTLLLNSIQIDGSAVGNDTPWSFDGTWYTYANASNDINLTYNIVTNYFEIYWQHVLVSTDTLDITFDTKINDGNSTEVLFLDGNSMQLTDKALVTAGTIIENTFTVDSNRTVPTDSNEVNVTTDQRGIAAIPAKVLTATDQSFTDPGDLNLNNTPDVAVGEVIDVQLTFEFSGGTTRTVVLRDNFDAQNFVYVPGSTRLERSSDQIEVSDSDLNTSFASANPIAVDDSKLSHDATGFSLAIGDVFNDNYNAMNVTELLTLTFKLKVDNNVTVQAGVQLEDNASVSFSEYNTASNSSSLTQLHSPSVGVVVVEPDVEIIKTVNPLSASSGDMLTYTLKVCNDESNTSAHTTTGFDWEVTDTLPDELDLVGDPQYNGLSMFSGQDLYVVIDEIMPGACVILEYNVTVNGAAQFEQDINNTVLVESTSLPGTLPDERTGTGTPALNDLNNSSTATLQIEEPGVTKAIIGQKAYYPIGDIVEYNITLGFTGSARDLTIVDHFPAGLAYVAGSARLRLPTGATVSYDPPQESNSGYEWTFVFGDLNITTAGNLYLELNATVEDIAGNVDGTQLTNSLDMTFTDPNSGASVTIPGVSPSITVGEPELIVTKTITTDLSVPKSAGDVISYSIEIENSGTTTAYFVEWEDKVPVHTGEIHNPHQQVHAGTAYETNTTTPITDASFIISTVDEPDDHITLAPFDLSPGATLVITFDTIIQPNVIPAETLVNITGATTQSLVGGGRTHNGINGDKYATVAEVSFSINQLPEAIDDCTPPLHVTHYGPNEGDLGSNDILGDGTKEEHTWRVITQPTYGTVVVNKDGTYIYTPDPDINNVADSFLYEIEDSNGDKDQARVCIDVDCSSSQTSDGGDALSMVSILILAIMTVMTGLYFIRKEEERGNL